MEIIILILAAIGALSLLWWAAGVVARAQLEELDENLRRHG